MKHFSNVPTNKINWLKHNKLGGVISDLYYPETIDEMICIVRQCQSLKKDFYVFGHLSNSYLLPSFSPEIVISIINLREYSETEKMITVECGMHTKVLAKMMVENGYVGFEGLVDLPGTVSGAVYGNAGCYGCLISDHLVSVRILTSSGEILDFTKDSLGFQERTSSLKSGIIKGTILTATFEKIEGDKNELKNGAMHAHTHRLASQPGPGDNLGSIFKRDELTTLGNWIRRIGRYTSKMLNLPEESSNILKLKLFLSGYPSLGKYLFDLNRFIWKDEKANEAFEKYIKLRKKLFRHNEFEIEIFR